MGEIGKAIARFYKNPFTKDLTSDNLPEELEVLHVCIPYSKKFVEIVKENISQHKPVLVIIHSTVPVGTTRQISDFHYMTVHSPCRGVHPNLYEGIKTFVKFIGTNKPTAGRYALEHFKKIGIKGEVFFKSETTELLKLLDTSYYGMAIAFHAYANKLCNKHKVNFESVMTRGNQTYNEGYAKLGKKNVVRPVLYAPENDKIFGHCVVENSELLERQGDGDLITKTILRHKSYAGKKY